ncbi:glycine cleavage system aminomethyltransferase GcvT [Saccharothrix coeruleofusca]|uniref:Aminomethyltransferase n=1 Tax=Saccharothrix coeruleofusca TaxID=33919 RepID=A0A918ANF6_9PSEU|nr:glycine cleavage system aminomethyltransferase GcvT [Saccharothrix coeruleofusca]MBP2338239.1 aminomethyltransferase [Saccharothrix coeruleofusca]GGP49799.1 aminomethyltransferase [Saccharothrix coeruleofusca]
MESRRTPLHAEHEALGAQFTDFAGWRMPLRYDSELAEHRAVRTSAGLFDLTHMGEILVTGAEAGAALDHALVGHASAIGVGRARYTMICRPDGGVLDDLIVYRTGETEYLVVANAANAGVVHRELVARAEGFAAEVTDKSADFALLAVQGPASTEILAGLTPTDLAEVKYYASYPTTVADRPALLARTGYTGEDGFELFLDPADAPAVWRALLAAGAPHELKPAGLGCRDTLRLEAGMPLYGNELGVDRTPFHAGLGRVVKLDKPGDFVGREALAKVAEQGVDSALVGLRTDSRRAPRHGYPVLDDSGAPVGEVTSGALSPTLGYSVAMAYVTKANAEPGTRLTVDVRGRREPVEVVALPFYKRKS